MVTPRLIARVFDLVGDIAYYHCHEEITSVVAVICFSKTEAKLSAVKVTQSNFYGASTLLVLEDSIGDKKMVVVSPLAVSAQPIIKFAFPKGAKHEVCVIKSTSVFCLFVDNTSVIRGIAVDFNNKTSVEAEPKQYDFGKRQVVKTISEQKGFSTVSETGFSVVLPNGIMGFTVFSSGDSPTFLPTQIRQNGFSYFGDLRTSVKDVCSPSDYYNLLVSTDNRVYWKTITERYEILQYGVEMELAAPLSSLKCSARYGYILIVSGNLITRIDTANQLRYHLGERRLSGRKLYTLPAQVGDIWEQENQLFAVDSQGKIYWLKANTQLLTPVYVYWNELKSSMDLSE